jgi:hypothetical protein
MILGSQQQKYDVFNKIKCYFLEKLKSFALKA